MKIFQKRLNLYSQNIKNKENEVSLKKSIK